MSTRRTRTLSATSPSRSHPDGPARPGLRTGRPGYRLSGFSSQPTKVVTEIEELVAHRELASRQATMKAPAGIIELPFGRVPRGRYLEVESGDLAFVRTHGRVRKEPPVLLLHGLGATGALNWAGCFEPLSQRTQVIALDHRAHGRGPRIGNEFRLVDCADDAAAVLRRLDRGPAIVAGYSMGGPIAQLLALRHPDLVSGLVLSATARDFRGRPAERLRFGAVAVAAAIAPFRPGALAPSVIPVLPGGLRPLGWALAELRRHEPVGLLAAAAALGRFSSREWIGSIQPPAAVIVHTRDRLVPAHRQRKLADALPDASVVEVDLDHTGVGRESHRYVPALLQAHAAVVDRVTELAA
jgi:3-oxoadipate enol-lactonase